MGQSLSAREGIPPNQWCYEPNRIGQYAPGMKVRLDVSTVTGYRLPTQAEWEYACRANTVTARHFGRGDELLPRYGWSWKTAEGRTRPVGQLRPNDLGLYDMLGNVMEWTEYPQLLPLATLTGSLALSRCYVIDDRSAAPIQSGSFANPPYNLVSSYRSSIALTARNNDLGFRVARTIIK
jgi:formylglycine-generating enzyme required for sulfatase activity